MKPKHSSKEEAVDFKKKKSTPSMSASASRQNLSTSKKQHPSLVLQQQEVSSASASASDSDSDSDSDAEVEESLKPPIKETHKQGSSSEEEEVGYKLKKSSPLSASAAVNKLLPNKQDPPPVLQSRESSSESFDSASGSDIHSVAEADKGIKPMEETLTHKRKFSEKPDMIVISPAKRPRQSKTQRVKKDSEARAAAVDDLTSKGDKTTKLFQRIWTEKDEIAILKGMDDYLTYEVDDPSKSMKKIYYFIHKSFHVDISIKQFKDKVHKLKKKYQKNLRRGKNGKDPTFNKVHEKEIFELSKKVWNSNDGVKFNGTPLEIQKTCSSSIPSECLSEPFDFNNKRGVGGLCARVLDRGLDMIEGSTVELKEQQKRLHFAQIQLSVQHIEFALNQVKSTLEEYKSLYN